MVLDGKLRHQVVDISSFDRSIGQARQLFFWFHSAVRYSRIILTKPFSWVPSGSIAKMPGTNPPASLLPIMSKFAAARQSSLLDEALNKILSVDEDGVLRGSGGAAASRGRTTSR